jgi:(R)-2-hydroxyacyl-CoA dehydratese activating ATPase
MAYFLGIDIGSGTSKGAIVTESKPLAYCSRPSGINYRKAADNLLDELLKTAKISPAEISYTVATGQGATSVVSANQCVIDLRCCARGIFNLYPDSRTIIDIEGQTTQVIRLGEKGQIINFVTSEKCASGSGRFLEIIANVLQIPLSEIGNLSLKSKNPVNFTTACAVFGESEAVSRVAEGITPEDILAGVHKAMADKIGTMVERVGLDEPCVVCGGCGLNIGLVQSLEKVLKVHTLVPPRPHLITALGAAWIAQEAGRGKP